MGSTMLVGGALLVIVGVVIAINLAGSPRKAQASSEPERVSTPRARTTSIGTNSTDDRVVSGKKPPARPAPHLPEGTFRACRELLETAKQAYNRAEKMRRTENHNKKAYFAELSVCKDKCEQAIDKLTPVLRWDEEAELQDWYIPAHVERVRRLFQEINNVEHKAIRSSKGR